MAKGYSLQEEKIQSVADRVKEEAEQWRHAKREQIKRIRERFLELKKEFPNCDIVFEESITRRLKDEVREMLNEAQLEAEYGVRIAQIRCERLKRFFLDELEQPLGGVTKSDGREGVLPLRFRKLTDFMRDELETIASKVEEAKLGTPGSCSTSGSHRS